MQTVIDPSLQQHPDLLQGVEAANRFLQERLHKYPFELRIEWQQLSDEHGAPAAGLSLADTAHLGPIRFSLQELQQRELCERRLGNLIGDWLSAQTWAMLKRLDEDLTLLEEDERATANTK